MKRVINGMTYNTDTATKLAQKTWESPFGRTGAKGVRTLYQTKGGAFFLFEENTEGIWNERAGEYEVKTTCAFIPINRKYAEEWILEGKEAKIFNNPFGDPPEAAADASTGETMLVRMPPALKRQIEEAAKANDVSMNAFMLRCIEACMRERTAG
jgi:hypothetical protein